MPSHLRPTAAIAADLLLPSDPGLALALAQELLDKPLMANHSHGLWGYSGRGPERRELTIQATGIGGPSAAVVLAELAEHGGRRAVRIGRCAALDPGLAAGETVVVGGALAADGTSRALGGEGGEPEPGLAGALRAATGAGAVTVASSDLFHDPERVERRAAWREAGAAVTDLETAALLALGRRLGVPVAAALVVAEDAAGEGDEPRVEAALLALGRAAARALAQAPVAEASS